MQIKPFIGLRENEGSNPMVMFNRLALLFGTLLRYRCWINGFVICVVCLGFILASWITVTMQYGASFNDSLSSFFLLGIVIGGALYLLECFPQSLRVERIAVKRTQRSVTRES
ncbi:MAG: hypothetical protein ACKOB7_04500 [Methylocystis sp.]